MIFSYNKDINKNAYMNWRTRPSNIELNFGTIAEGYLSSARILVEKCIEDNSLKIADILIYPVLFNTIHGIEIYLKAIYMRLAYLLGKEQGFAGGHDIRNLSKMVKGLVKEFKNDDYQFQKYQEVIQIVEMFIKEIYSKTDKMDFARYPIDNKKKENHFYIDNIENEIVNLPILLDKIIKIQVILEQILNHFLYDYEKS